MSELIIIDLQPQHAAEARRLIQAGLAEHWGWLDESLNPDLADILSAYAGETFLAAFQERRLVGTGALIREAEGVGRIVRMSVAISVRREGIGRQILEALCQRARQRGFERLVLETTETWQDAIAFYQRFGFRLIDHRDGEVHFVMLLDRDSSGSTHSGGTGL